MYQRPYPHHSGHNSPSAVVAIPRLILSGPGRTPNLARAARARGPALSPLTSASGVLHPFLLPSHPSRARQSVPGYLSPPHHGRRKGRPYAARLHPLPHGALILSPLLFRCPSDFTYVLLLSFVFCFCRAQRTAAGPFLAHSRSQTPLPAFRKALRFRPVSAVSF